MALTFAASGSCIFRCCLWLVLLTYARGETSEASLDHDGMRAWCGNRKNPGEIVIGVIGKGLAASYMTTWRPTFETYLSAQIASYGCHTTLYALTFTNYDECTKQGVVDFIFLHPTGFQEMKNRYDVSAFLSIKRNFNGGELDRYGGVIVRAANKHTTINTIADLALDQHHGLTICGVSSKALCGWPIQWYEMLKNGVDVMGDYNVQFLEGHKATIRGAIDGTCDIAMARSEIVERLIAAGEFTDADIFTIGNQGPALGFPQRISTELYPEWPLAALNHVPREIAQMVAVPLLNIKKTDTEAVQGKYYGFTFPYSYEPVRKMLVAIDAAGDGSCDPGMYREGTNPGICKDCPFGSMSEHGVGACQLCPRGTYSNLTCHTKCSLCPDGLTSNEGSTLESMCKPVDEFPIVLVLSIIGGGLGALLIGFMLWRYVIAIRKGALLEKERAETIIHQIEEAQAFATELRTPFVLLRASDFVEMGQLQSQEQLRSEGTLVYLDTLEEATQFLSPHVSIFFSHQWLGWHHPDPNGVQYAVMCEAIYKVMDRENMGPNELSNVFVWVDYYSIPQKCSTAQKAAVEQLGTLASICSYFIVTAPEAIHLDTGDTCNRETYHSRCWCRAEIFSHWARRGCSTFDDPDQWSKNSLLPRRELQNMFYMTETDLESMVPTALELKSSFLEAVTVFAGNTTCCMRCHNNGTQPCDRETLMLPMLGLYTEIYANRKKPAVKDMYELIANKVDSIFPKTFEYAFAEGETVTRPLFGDLIKAVEAVVQAAGSDGESDVLIKMSTSRCNTPTSKSEDESPAADIKFGCCIGKNKESSAVDALGRMQPGAIRTNDSHSHGHGHANSGSHKATVLSEVGKKLPTVNRRLSENLSKPVSSPKSDVPERFKTSSHVQTRSKRSSYTEGFPHGSPELSMDFSTSLHRVNSSLSGKTPSMGRGPSARRNGTIPFRGGYLSRVGECNEEGTGGCSSSSSVEPELHELETYMEMSPRQVDLQEHKSSADENLGHATSTSDLATLPQQEGLPELERNPSTIVVHMDDEGEEVWTERSLSNLN